MFPGSAWPALSPVAYVTKYTQLTAPCCQPDLKDQCPISAWEVSWSALVFIVTLEFLRAGGLGETLATALPMK